MIRVETKNALHFSGRSVRQTASSAVLRISVMTTPLFALHALQSGNVQDFDCSRCATTNKTLAFQFREGAFRGLGYRSKVIREIETVHRQFQERLLFIEELGKTQQIENERGKALTRVLLTEGHDSMFGLTKIVGPLHKQMQLELWFGQHHLLHPLPRNAIDSGWSDGLCRVDVSSVLGTTQKIARHPECQNLPAAVFGASAYANDPLIDKIEEAGIFALGEDRACTAPVDECRRILEELFLFFA